MNNIARNEIHGNINNFGFSFWQSIVFNDSMVEIPNKTIKKGIYPINNCKYNQNSNYS